VLAITIEPGEAKLRWRSPAARCHLTALHRVAPRQRNRRTEAHAFRLYAAEVIWASSRGGGFWRSSDDGQHWVSESTGINEPKDAWAIAYFRGALYASDTVRVYRWDGSAWQPSSDHGLVVFLDPSADGRKLFASSMGQGIRVFDGHTWLPANEGLSTHAGSRGAIHVVSVTAAFQAPALAATMLGGVALSQDGGRDWSELRAGLPVGAVWRVIQVDHRLIAASGHGIYEYRLPQSALPGVAWWVLVIVAASGTGILAIVWGALPRGWSSTKRRRRPR
jgi:hypothetical protein